MTENFLTGGTKLLISSLLFNRRPAFAEGDDFHVKLEEGFEIQRLLLLIVDLGLWELGSVKINRHVWLCDISWLVKESFRNQVSKGIILFFLLFYFYDLSLVIEHVSDAFKKSSHVFLVRHLRTGQFNGIHYDVSYPPVFN